MSWWFQCSQLDDVLQSLETIHQQLSTMNRRLNTMSTNIGALDNAISTLTSDVATLKTAVESLIAAIPPGDFSAEIQAVQDAFASVEQTTQEATDATPPPAETG